MRHRLYLTLALTLAALVLRVPVAHAQEAPPAPPPNSTSVSPDFIPPNGGSTYRYWDDDGWGTLRVINAAHAWYSGDLLVQVRLTQNGRSYVGSGLVLGNRIYFTILGYFFQGQTLGWGSYHYSLDNPGNQIRFYLQ